MLDFLFLEGGVLGLVYQKAQLSGGSLIAYDNEQIRYV